MLVDVVALNVENVTVRLVLFFFWPPPFKRWSRFNPPPSSSSSPLELPHSSSMYFFGILLFVRLGAIDLFLVRVRLTFFFRERTKEETRIEPPFRFVVDDCGAAQQAFLGFGICSPVPENDRVSSDPTRFFIFS